jgi:dihydrolipoamide dehydrogenase
MAVTEDKKLVVLGGGPGGYAAAFLAADLGMSVTLIDKESNPGGVCLYRGCIPSKALLHAAKLISDAEHAKEIGINFNKPKINVKKLRDWKSSVVEKMTGGLGILSKQRKITYIQGTATFQNSQSLEVVGENGEKQKIPFDTCILAAGSYPSPLPGNRLESVHIWDSTDALALEEIPESLLVIGGGYIGLELGSVYATLGSKVSVVEILPGIMPGADRDLVNVFNKKMKGHFEDIMLKTRVTSMQEVEEGLRVRLDTEGGGAEDKVFSKVLVSVGRKPNSQNLGLEYTNVTLDERGFVKVNPQRQTDDPAIYAIGDIVGGALLAHKASHEGRVAVEAIQGKKVAFEPLAIPGVVYTDPEIAFTGFTETEARSQGREVKVLKFPWAASGRAVTMGLKDGLTKLIVDPETERVLGMGIAGTGAGEMISEGTLAIEMGAVAKDLALTIHPHPTLSETVMETAEMLYGTCTHIYRPLRK